MAITTLESIFTSGVLSSLARRRSYLAAADDIADFFLAAMTNPGKLEGEAP